MDFKETYFPIELWRVIMSYNKIPKAPMDSEKTADIIKDAANNLIGPVILKTCLECDTPAAWMLVFADKVFYKIDEGYPAWLCKSCIKTYRIPKMVY